MTLPPKRYEIDTHQKDINDLIEWCDTLLIGGGGVPATRGLVAGDGLTGGGDLSTDRTFNLGTPDGLSPSSTNNSSANSHTHAVSGFEPTVSKGNLTAGSSKVAIGGTGTGAVIGAGASIDISEGNLTHNNIGSLQGGAAGEYNHLTNVQVSALHAAVTLAVGSDAALSLSGQELTLADVLTPTEHSSIGNGSPHHAPITLAAGSAAELSLDGQQLTLAAVLTPTEHTDIGNGSPHHAPITLAIGSASELALNGQELTLAAVLTPTEHTDIGDSSPHHAAATAGTGISLSGQQVSLNLAAGLTWTGNLVFQGANTYRHLMPEASDTYDIGAYDKIWRSAYMSSLNTTIFAENTVQIIGGEFMVPKQTGILPAVSSAATTIDFGTTMTPDDFVLVKAHDAGGSVKTEYIQVGSNVTGTTYNVTRDVAAAHATDPAWSDGTPFVVLGNEGDGYLRMLGGAVPYFGVLGQGDTYNGAVEMVRLGDLYGNWGYASATYGIAIGEYATGKANLTYDPTNGLRLSVYDTPYLTFGADAKITGDLVLDGGAVMTDGGETVLNENGITLLAGTVYDDVSTLKWYDSGSDVRMYQTVIKDTGGGSWGGTLAVIGESAGVSNSLSATAVTTKTARTYLHSASDSSWMHLFVEANDSDSNSNTLTLEDDSYTTLLKVDYLGNLSIAGNYKRGSTTGYIYVPCSPELTSTSWDGDAHSSEGATKIDTSAVFGAPAGIKVAVLSVRCRDSATLGATNLRFYFYTETTNIYDIVVPIGGDVLQNKLVIIPCDANGDFYYSIVASGTNTMDCWIEMDGYYI